MNPVALGQFIMMTFAPFIPLVSGGVMAIALATLLIILIRRLLPEDLPQ